MRRIYVNSEPRSAEIWFSRFLRRIEAGSRNQVKLSDIPKGNYTQIKAKYSIGAINIEDIKPYRFNVIGMVRHTQYGPVNEAECSGPSDFNILLMTKPPNLHPERPCGQVAGTIKTTFQRLAQTNNHGNSTSYGLIQKEELCGANNVRVNKWQKIAAGELVGSAHRKISESSLAIFPGRDGLMYGDRLLILNGGNGQIKTVDDACPACRPGAGDNGQDSHIDNWRAVIKSCGSVATNLDIANYKTIKLVD